MSIYVSNITIEQGFDFESVFQLEDTRTNSFLDLRNSTPSAQMRKSPGSSTVVSFASSIPNPKQGLLSISLGSSITSSLKPGRYVYDVRLEADNGKYYKAVEGSVLVRAGVTR